jgi:hypothetical protein
LLPGLHGVRLSLLAAVIACASSGGGATPRSNPDLISRNEIYNSNSSNAYELVARLRPQWLRAPATGSIGAGLPLNQAILVYLDRQRLETLDALKTISVGGIDTVQWIDAGRVQTIMGDAPSGPIAGAIVFKTRK